jgi:hypothetical protein
MMEDNSFIGRLHRAKELLAAQREMEAKQVEPVVPEDPWLAVLAQIRGDQNKDGTSYVSTNMLLEILAVEPRDRKAAAHKRIASIMTSLNWLPTRMFGLNARASLSQIRGYCRDDRHEQRRQPAPQQLAKHAEMANG